jgi:GT2 family glycosyltransferase
MINPMSELSPHILAILVNDGYAQPVLKALLQQTLPLSTVAVVNQAGLPLMPHQHDHTQVITYNASADAGYAAAINPILRQWLSRVDAVWLLDGKPDPYTLQQLWQSVHQKQALVSAGVLFNTALMTRAYQVDRLRGRLVPKGFTDKGGMEVLSRHGTLIPASVFKQIGLLDERLHKYWEMADFCLRARAAGFDLLVHPKAKVSIRQPATAQTASDLFYMVRNRWWVVQPLQNLWQSAAMMVWDGWIWLGLVTEWLMANTLKKGNSLAAYEKARLYWWGVYQGVHPFPPKIQ